MFRKFFFLLGLRARKVRRIGDFLYKMTTFAGNNYSVWKMKNKRNTVLVLIHDDDDEIAAVTDVDGKYLYFHPRTLDGAKYMLNLKAEGSKN